MFKKKQSKKIKYLLSPKYRFVPYGAYTDVLGYLKNNIFTVRPVEFIVEIVSLNKSIVIIHGEKREIANEFLFDTEIEAKDFVEKTNIENIERYGQKINKLEEDLKNLTERINKILK